MMCCMDNILGLIFCYYMFRKSDNFWGGCRLVFLGLDSGLKEINFLFSGSKLI